MDSKNSKQDSFSFWRYGENTMEPVGPIGIITQQLDKDFAADINRHLRRKRQAYIKDYPELREHSGYLRTDYSIAVDTQRFSTGEGRAKLIDDVRGHDIYIITDVLNDAAYMKRGQQYISLSPDDHYHDLLRIINAIQGTCSRINVIMPFLREGRRYLRQSRESTDCALMLRQLFSMGISNFITYDAHDSRVDNAVPRYNFENFPTASEIIAKVLETVPDINLSSEGFMVSSPSETTIRRAVYYASLMKVPLSTFYSVKEPDGSFVRGFLGDDVSGKDIFIVDDMLDKIDLLISCAKYLKEKGAKRVFAICTFALIDDGYLDFADACDLGIIDKIFATNLTRIPRFLQDKEWFVPVDMSYNIASAIDALNHNASLNDLLNSDTKIKGLLDNHKAQV